MLEIDDFSSTKLLAALLRSRQLVMFTDGRRLEQLLSAEEYEKVSEASWRAPACRAWLPAASGRGWRR